MIVLASVKLRLLAVLATLAAAGLLGGASSASGAVAPGQVTFPFDVRPTIPVPDVFGAPSVGVARPDGGVVLAGVDRGHGALLVAVRRDGTPDPSFGDGGFVHLAVPYSPQYIGALPLQLLRRPDGRMLLVFQGPLASRYETPHLVVAGLTADGALDSGFGADGIADVGVQVGCGVGCTPAALQADGSLVLAGTTGQVSPAIEHDPNAPSDTRWVVARLTPGGQLDTSFGDGGIATIAGGGSHGLSIASGAGGAITTVGTSGGGAARLTRLASDGRPDPSFAGGAPVSAGSASDLAVGADGSVDTIGRDGLRRFTAAGTADGAFGDAGRLAAVTGTLLSGPGGELVVDAQGPGPDGRAHVRATRIDANGTPVAAAPVTLAFGGGYASIFARIRAPRPTPLVQSTYQPGRPVLRADGSVLIPGAVGVIQPTGEGAGFSHVEEALVGLTPQLTLDRGVGGPSRRARVRVRVPRRRAALDIPVDVTTSGPGLVDLRITAGRRVIAHSTAPAMRTGRQRLSALLTRTGRRWQHTGRRLRVTVTARFRDLVGRRATMHVRAVVR